MRRGARVAVTIAVTTLVVATASGLVLLWSAYTRQPLPLADQCAARVGESNVSIEPERAYWAGIIAGGSIKRGLEPRAASIALTTAYQESGMRNLDYGHSDSLGLFQQRPSKGWGTQEEVMNPWYSTKAFYAALVKVKNWDSDDINDVAQKVQRSAYPEAYRKHVTKARTLASSLTGETPASFSCSVADRAEADPSAMKSYLEKSLGTKAIEVSADETTVTVVASKPRYAWAAAHLAIAATAAYGLDQVEAEHWVWTHDRLNLSSWQGTGSTEVSVLILRFVD